MQKKGKERKRAKQETLKEEAKKKRAKDQVMKKTKQNSCMYMHT